MRKLSGVGVLFNDRKERAFRNPSSKKEDMQQKFLVRPQEDMLAQQKKQMLEHHFGIDGIRSIRHGVLWNVMSKENITHLAKQVINSHILFNPYAHDCYYY